MKRKFLYSVAVLTSISMLSACVGDLDAEPIDTKTKTADVAFASSESYAQYANYAYSYYSLVSQSDPGTSDIAVSDAGQSEFIRQYQFLNELSTDAMKCIWGDDYIDGVQYQRWTTTNTAVIAVYLRALKGVAICNQFLDESVSGDSAVTGRGHGDMLDEVRAYRGELRLLRAIYYEILLDMFGNPPLALPEHIGSTVFPSQLGRQGLFEWVENECLELIDGDELPATRVAYPRLSKGAAYAVLARMYLNAEVYTGTARWQDAQTYAEKCIAEGGYSLCPNYSYMFRQDNSTNGAQNEFIVAALYDSNTTQSWGGTTHLISSSINSDMMNSVAANLMATGELASGYDQVYIEQWNGYHVSNEFVMDNFDLQGVVWDGSKPFGYDREASDKRALFYNEGFSQTFNNSSSEITSGWACLKWLPLTSAGVPWMITQNQKFSSADFPIFRLAEMYLISAEAEARMNGNTLTATNTGYQRISQLRQRANGASDVMPATIDLDYILRERTRELMWEGHRRPDLIRYGYYTSSTYPWPYKAGILEGNATIDSYRTIFPIIQSDMQVNDNLVQNPGY